MRQHVHSSVNRRGPISQSSPSHSTGYLLPSASNSRLWLNQHLDQHLPTSVHSLWSVTPSVHCDQWANGSQLIHHKAQSHSVDILVFSWRNLNPTCQDQRKRLKVHLLYLDHIKASCCACVPLAPVIHSASLIRSGHQANDMCSKKLIYMEPFHSCKRSSCNTVRTYATMAEWIT